MPYWAVIVVIVVIVVAYYLLSTRRQRKEEGVVGDFAKMPDFHANQVYSDVRGDTAIGLDDRGRRIAVARRNERPRTKIYSFSHILAVEVVQNGTAITRVAKPATAGEDGQAGPDSSKPGPDVSPATDDRSPTTANLGPAAGLFGSTAQAPGASPVIRPALGPLTSLGIRVALVGEPGPGVFVRFYEGKPVDIRSVAAENAFAQARMSLNGLDIAIRRAGLPPRPAISGSGLGPRD